jgi:ABC-type dipeptide/oligopeptide/nickel transport system permease subunit
VAAISALTLGLCLAVVVISYGVIIATTQRTPRELAWTILPALLLVVVLVVTAQTQFAR